MVNAREEAGYRIVLSSRDGRTLEALVEATVSKADAPFPVDPIGLPSDARGVLDAPGEPSLSLDRASRILTEGARTVGEAVERVIAFTSRRIRYDSPGASGSETAAATLARGRGSCVGRSLLAAELLNRSGIPARQVSGILAAASPLDLTPDTRPFFSDVLGGVRHRWIEVHVPGLGWVPSDPGGLAGGVTARYVALASAPGSGFGLEALPR